MLNIILVKSTQPGFCQSLNANNSSVMASAKFGLIHSATTAMRGNSELAIYMAVAAQLEPEIIRSSTIAVWRDAMLDIQMSMTTQMEGRVVSSSSTACCKRYF